MVGSKVSYGLAAALMLCGSAAGALTPLPECAYDHQSGKLVPWHTQSGRLQDIYYGTPGKGFVDWSLYTGRRVTTLVLQNCQSGDEMIVSVPKAGHEAILARWEALLYGEGKYSVQQVKLEMERHGASVRRSRNALGTCACDQVAQWN